jgi:hypothetical protein
MKRFLIVLAAIMVIFVIAGCDNGTTGGKKGGGGGDDKPGDTSIPDLVIEGADIKLVKIGSTAGQEADGNKYILKTTGGGDVGSAGFGYAFSEEEEKYKFVKLEAKITEIDSNSCAAFTIKSSTTLNDLAGFGGNSVPQYSRNAELNVGDTVGDEAKAVEMKKDDVITDQFLTSLFTGGIYFQFNHYAEYWKPGVPPLPHQDAGIHAKLKGNQDFTIEVTKITFTNGGTGSPDIELTADHFTVGNSKQYLDKGTVTAVTVTANGGIDVGAISIFYGTSYDTAVPQTVGTHKVFIDAAGAAGYKPAVKLEVGNLEIEATSPLYVYELKMENILPAGNDGDALSVSDVAPLGFRGLDGSGGNGTAVLSIEGGKRGIKMNLVSVGWDALTIPVAAVGSFAEGDEITVTGKLAVSGDTSGAEVMINIGGWGPVGGNAKVNDGDDFKRSGVLDETQATNATTAGFIQIRGNNLGGGTASVIIYTITYKK